MLVPTWCAFLAGALTRGSSITIVRRFEKCTGGCTCLASALRGAACSPFLVGR